MAKVMLIDGNSLTYRAFFALPTHLATASGQVTNAVLGFTSMLINLLRDHRPDEVAIAFDRPEPTFRHVAIETYKAQREAAPDILYQQLGLVRQVVDVLGIPVFEVAGYEADDVLATLATRARDRGDDALVVTGDRDSYQLVEDPHVKVLYNKRGVSDYVLYDEAGIRDRTGVAPRDYVIYAALRGDPSDNLPGVPGVGEKTAAKLVQSYGDLDSIFAHADELSPKLRANLTDSEQMVRINAQVMALVRDVPLNGAPSGMAVDRIDRDELRRLFEFLEFKNLYEKLLGVLDLGPDPSGAAVGSGGGDMGASTEPPSVRVPADVGDLCSELGGFVASRGMVGVGYDRSGSSGGWHVSGIALVADMDNPVALWVAWEHLSDPVAAEQVSRLLGDHDRGVVIHDAKAVMRELIPMGIDVTALVLDPMVAAYLVEPGGTGYDLAGLAARYTALSLGAGSTVPEGQLDLAGEGPDLPSRSAEQGLASLHLVDPLREALHDQGLIRLNDEVEVPLVRVLAKMEVVGIGVDVAALEQLNVELSEMCSQLTSEIWDQAGEQFNVNSTPQLRTVLFDRLGLTPQKKTKTGYSTDAATLEKLRDEHPIVELLLRYREVEKLRSTYAEGLLAEVADDGRIHATFNQTVARTGRLSSDAPNLHNIPVRSELGRSFRKVFVPAPGFDLLVADYNQIELRCIAHLAEDPGLIEAFESGRDIHNATASRVFGVDSDEVTIEQRSKAKMVSYGLAYGMEAYGLAQRLGIPNEEAQAILDAYFAAFPAVHDYMQRTVAEARDKGYTETLFGRRRQIPELSSTNFRVRQAGERQAMNAGIQGLAADIFKVALVRLDRALEQAELRSRLILQVHDEVLVEVASDEREVVHDTTVEVMTSAFAMRVPLEVNIAFGRSWAAAKG